MSLHMLRRFSRVRLFATPWTVACQASLSTGFTRQDYWDGLLFPSPGHIPDPGTEHTSLMSPNVSNIFGNGQRVLPQDLIMRGEKLCSYVFPNECL